MAGTGTDPAMGPDRRAESCLEGGSPEEDARPPDPMPSGPYQAASDADITTAQDGDEAAFRRLYHDVQPRLLRYLNALAGAEAEDIAAETWLQITRDLHRFRGDLAAFRAWAARIARNRAIDQFRRARRRPLADVRADELTDLADRDLPEETVMARLAAAEALRLIATLPPDQAEAVLLRVIMDLDATHAGRVLGKRAGAIRTAAHRGLRTLAQRLADEI
jgi:RNA polymerase sigma-70 factor, ECF subfamily